MTIRIYFALTQSISSCLTFFIHYLFVQDSQRSIFFKLITVFFFLQQMRYDIPEDSNSRLGVGDAYSPNDASSEQCTLIRHELTASNSPPQPSTTFIPTIQDRTQINMLNFVVQQPQLSSSKDLPLDASVPPQNPLTRLSPDLTNLTGTLPEQVNPMNLDVKNEQSSQSYPSTSCGQNPFSPNMDGIPLVGAMTDIKSGDASLSFPDISNT